MGFKFNPIGMPFDVVDGTGSDWTLTGNAGTTAGTNFLGTTDAIDLVFKANNAEVGRFVSGGGMRIANLTSGSALFAGTSGLVSEDTTNFLWDNTVKKLTVSTSILAAVSTGTTVILNGNPFVTGLTSWTFVSGWSYSAAGALHASGNTNTLSQSFSTTSGRVYRVQYTLGTGTSGTLTCVASTAFSSTTVSSSATSGTKTGYFYADDITSTITFTPGSTQTRLITAVKVELMTMATSPISFNYFVDVRSYSNQSFYIGIETGQNCTTGASNNTIIGQQAFRRNVTGNSNTGFGFGVLDSTVTGGNSNTAFGNTALFSNTTGTFNCAFGNTALYSNTTSTKCIAFGDQALYANTTGNFNIAIGSESLRSVTTGTSNTALGYLAGRALTTGQNNLIIGSSAGASLLAGTGNTFIGNAADNGSDVSNQINIGNTLYGDSFTKVIGIDEISPQAKLHITGTTEQQRVAYDASNYYSTTVGSTGGITFDAVGSGAAFTLSDAVTVDAALTVKAGLSSDTAKTGGVMSVNTTTVGNVGVGEDDLMTYSVPASTLGTNGDYVDFEGSGTIASSVNAKRIRAYFGAALIFDTGATGIPISAAIDWTIWGKVVRTGATTQKCMVSLNTNNATLATYADYTTATETLSGAVTLKLTAEAVSDNDVAQEIMTVEWKPSNA